MNYLQFVNNVLETAKSHKLVYEVGEGDIYEHLNSGDHKYPCVFLTVQNIDYNASSLNGTQMTVTGSLFYVDALLSDTSNKLQIQATGMTTLQQIFMRLMDNYPDFELRTGRYTPFDEKFADLCAGVFSNFTVSFMDDICIVNDDIFEEKPAPTIKDYFCFTALEDSAVTWSTVAYNNDTTYDEEIHIQYSKDGKTWTDWNNARESRRVSLNKGSKLYVKGVNNTLSYRSSKYFLFDSYETGLGNTGSLKVSGNIMSLIYGEDFEDKNVIASKFCFGKLFREANCISEVDLTLPATTLHEQCYFQLLLMTFDVKKIKMTLPAVQLVKGCYYQMLAVSSEHTDIDVTILAENIPTDGIYMKDMFGHDSVDNTMSGTIHKKKNTVLPDNCYIPAGVTVVDID